MADFIAYLMAYKYALLVPLAIVEGPLVSIYSGFLIQSGFFAFLPTYGSLIVGDLIGDVIWYWVGYFYGHPFIKRFGKYFSVNEKSVKTVTAIFHRHNSFILLFSKITTGFGLALAVLITAGIVKIPFRRYMFLNTLGQFVWSAMMIGLGYFFGHLYSQISNVFGKISLFGLFVIGVLCLFGLGKYVGRRVTGQV